MLAGFFSRTQANEKAEIKFLLDPEQVLQESINIRTVAKKSSQWLEMENLLYEQYNLRDTFYGM